MKRYAVMLLGMGVCLTGRAQPGVSCRYWFDNDPTSRQTAISTGRQTIDVADLPEGLHALHVQAGLTDTQPSEVMTKVFMKVAPFALIDSVRVTTMVDNKPFASFNAASNGGGNISAAIDVESLGTGLHTFGALVTVPGSAPSSMWNTLFLRKPMEKETETLECFYSIDSRPLEQEASVLGAGSYHIDLDVDSLSEGIHCLSYIVRAKNRETYDMKSTFFLVSTGRGYGAYKVEYWLNDNRATADTLAVSDPRVPLHLMQEIEVPVLPIRSMHYLFERDGGGKPWIYAVNRVSARAYGYTFTTEASTTEYVDRRSKAPVEGATPLEGSEGAAAFATPGAQAIKWFTVKALAGDSLSLWTDCPCFMEVYAPSDTPALRVGGAEATGANTLRLTEGGIYYVAVHDAETAGSQVTLSFTHSTASMAGDANGDGQISIADVTTTVNYIIDTVAGGFAFDAADMNGDGEITVGDVTIIANLVLSGTPGRAGARSLAAAPATAAARPLRFVSATALGTEAEAAVALDNPGGANYVACQLDVEMPAGMNLESASLSPANAGSHKAMWREVEPGVARVIVFSTGNERLDCKDALLRLRFTSEREIKAGGRLRMANALVDEVTPEKRIEEYASAAAEITLSTQSGLPDAIAGGISARAEGMTLHIFSPRACRVTITNAQGQTMTVELQPGDNVMEMTQAGVYLVSNQKVLLN